MHSISESGSAIGLRNTAVKVRCAVFVFEHHCLSVVGRTCCESTAES